MCAERQESHMRLASSDEHTRGWETGGRVGALERRSAGVDVQRPRPRRGLGLRWRPICGAIVGSGSGGAGPLQSRPGPPSRRLAAARGVHSLSPSLLHRPPAAEVEDSVEVADRSFDSILATCPPSSAPTPLLSPLSSLSPLHGSREGRGAAVLRRIPQLCPSIRCPSHRMSSPAPFSLKVRLVSSGECRRVPLPLSPPLSFPSLVGLLASLFSLPPPSLSSLQLQFRDEEEELITLTSDAEWRSVVREVQERRQKVLLLPPPDPTAAIAAALRRRPPLSQPRQRSGRRGAEGEGWHGRRCGGAGARRLSACGRARVSPVVGLCAG